jgi:Mg2+ and Co2+ transporter CorA
MRSRGWALKGDTEEQKIEAAIVESEWSRFRFSEYLETMRENLSALGIHRSIIEDEIPTNNWEASDSDFQWIHQQLVDRKRDYELLTGLMAALAAIIGNRKTVKETSRVSEETVLSRREARAMKTFTVLALAFATLSLISSWFGMGNHAPG